VQSDEFSRCPATLPRNEYLQLMGEVCYEFAINHEFYWDQAQARCAKNGGNLVTINTPAIQQFLVDALEFLQFDKHGVWIGLNDRKTEGSFEWSTGQMMTSDG